MRAEVYRARGQFLKYLFQAQDNPEFRERADQVTRAYEQLAQAEEWLDGEVPPYDRSLSTRA